jgi:hypothetical protein
MVDTPVLTAATSPSETLEETQRARHQIRGHLQAIQIGLHLLERHFDMSANDLQAELFDLRASLHKTARVMDLLARAQQNRTSCSAE